MTNDQRPITNIKSQLEAVYPPDEAEALAWWVAEELSGLSRTQLQIGCKDTTFFANMQKIIDRLLNFEPIQYIFGHTLWCGLDLKLTSATLIPRPETAELVERINAKMSKYGNAKIGLTTNDERLTTNCKCLDIGTGSGCIAIALKKAHPEWQVTGIDISPEAIEVARENAIRNNVDVDFFVADIFESSNLQIFKSSNLQYDIVVSNPPYIRECEKSSMNPNVLNHEPASALFVPDDDPLRFYRRIAELCANDQRPTTNDQRPLHLFFEISEYFSDEIEHLLLKNGYSDIRIHNDIYGKPRIAEATLSGS